MSPAPLINDRYREANLTFLLSHTIENPDKALGRQQLTENYQQRLQMGIYRNYCWTEIHYNKTCAFKRFI